MSTRAYPPPQPIPDLTLVGIPGNGPEDVLPDRQGGHIFGLDDGRIVRRDIVGIFTELTQTGGRPLGLEWLPDGRLGVCDAERGILRVDPANPGASPEVLCDHVDNRPLILCNNLSAAPDGTIWFSTSSDYCGLGDVVRDIVENTQSGRLLRLVPGGAPEIMLEGLGFANGVAYLPGADGDRVLVAATAEAAIHVLWVSGDRAGKRAVFADRLPLMPDNLSVGTDGLIWVGGPSRFDAALAVVHRLPRTLRRGIAHVAARLNAQASPIVGAMAFDQAGQMVYHFQGKHPGFRSVTGVRDTNGTLWLSSLDCAAFAQCDLAPAAP